MVGRKSRFVSGVWTYWKIGAEYELGMAESLVIHDPMIGDKEGLIRGRGTRDQVAEREPCV